MLLYRKKSQRCLCRESSSRPAKEADDEGQNVSKEVVSCTKCEKLDREVSIIRRKMKNYNVDIKLLVLNEVRFLLASNSGVSGLTPGYAKETKRSGNGPELDISKDERPTTSNAKTEDNGNIPFKRSPVTRNAVESPSQRLSLISLPDTSTSSSVERSAELLSSDDLTYSDVAVVAGHAHEATGVSSTRDHVRSQKSSQGKSDTCSIRYSRRRSQHVVEENSGVCRGSLRIQPARNGLGKRLLDDVQPQPNKLICRRVTSDPFVASYVDMASTNTASSSAYAAFRCINRDTVQVFSRRLETTAKKYTLDGIEVPLNFFQQVYKPSNWVNNLHIDFMLRPFCKRHGPSLLKHRICILDTLFPRLLTQYYPTFKDWKGEIPYNFLRGWHGLVTWTGFTCL